VLLFFIKKISAIYKITDVSDKCSWFLVKDSFINVVSDQCFPECRIIVTKHSNKRACPSLATVNKRKFPDRCRTIQLFGVNVIRVH